MKKPLIAIPIGDCAGIGPEITVKALVSDAVKESADCIVIGSRKVLEKAIALTGAALTINAVRDPAEGDYRAGILNLIDMDNIDMAAFRYGAVQAMCGKAAYDYIEKSIELAMAGKADAVATTPINKEALHTARVPFIGHTEIFGKLTGTENPLTMFETNGLRVFFLTRHLSLLQMLGQIKKDKIVSCAKECVEALRKLGVTEGTMAVAGLNPHCGEHGLFGWEEVNEIEPAVRQLQSEGYQVAGPIGADSVFHQAAQGTYNSVLSLYHDQGHIAAKTLDFERTISVTNGMPILRTSVDHGTAFDIAGKNIASAVSMVEAIRLAAKYAPNFVKKDASPAPDAFGVHAACHLIKPVKKQKPQAEIHDLMESSPRDPVSRVEARAFGNFDLLVDGKRVAFKRAKSKELMAYLIDRHGASVTRREAFSVLWEDRTYDLSMQKQLDVVIRSMRATLEDYGVSEIFEMRGGVLCVHPDFISCDAWRYLTGDKEAIQAFRGEYMSHYSWVSLTESRMVLNGGK